jgi:hypothetical protein
MSKPSYKAKAVDGDKDGLLQDATEFERPVEAKAEDTVVTVTPPKAGVTHVVQHGETYAVLGEMYKTGNQSKHAKAVDIFNLNNGQILMVGDTIRIS